MLTAGNWYFCRYIKRSISINLVVFQLHAEAVVGSKKLTVSCLTLFQLCLQFHLIVPTHLLKLLQLFLGFLCTTHTHTHRRVRRCIILTMTWIGLLITTIRFFERTLPCCIIGRLARIILETRLVLINNITWPWTHRTTGTTGNHWLNTKV